MEKQAQQIVQPPFTISITRHGTEYLGNDEEPTLTYSADGFYITLFDLDGEDGCSIMANQGVFNAMAAARSILSLPEPCRHNLIKALSLLILEESLKKGDTTDGEATEAVQ